jgi:hypothetical protein
MLFGHSLFGYPSGPPRVAPPILHLCVALGASRRQLDAGTFPVSNKLATDRVSPAYQLDGQRPARRSGAAVRESCGLPVEASCS